MSHEGHPRCSSKDPFKHNGVLQKAHSTYALSSAAKVLLFRSFFDGIINSRLKLRRGSRESSNSAYSLPWALTPSSSYKPETMNDVINENAQHLKAPEVGQKLHLRGPHQMVRTSCGRRSEMHDWILLLSTGPFLANGVR